MWGWAGMQYAWWEWQPGLGLFIIQYGCVSYKARGREGGRERERGNKWKRWRHSAFWCALAALKSDLLSCVCVVIGDMLKCGTQFIWCVIFIFDCSQTGVSLFVLLFRTPKPFSEWIKKHNYSLSAAAVKYQTTTPHSSHSVQTSRHFHLMIYWWGICLFLVTCL